MTPQILSIASMVRTNIEAIAIREHFPRSLCGLCLRASQALVKALKTAGVRSRVIMGRYNDGWPVLSYDDSHCWVECGDEIIDLTATQFGIKDKIHVSKLGAETYKILRRSRRSVAEMARLWPREQQFRREDALEAIWKIQSTRASAP